MTIEIRVGEGVLILHFDIPLPFKDQFEIN